MTNNNQTIGDFLFGLEDSEAHARFVESLYREMEPLNEWGDIPSGITFAEVADVILDTIANYAGMGPIPATELPTLINDALEQLRE